MVDATEKDLLQDKAIRNLRQDLDMLASKVSSAFERIGRLENRPQVQPRWSFLRWLFR